MRWKRVGKGPRLAALQCPTICATFFYVMDSLAFEVTVQGQHFLTSLFTKPVNFNGHSLAARKSKHLNRLYCSAFVELTDLKYLALGL